MIPLSWIDTSARTGLCHIGRLIALFVATFIFRAYATDQTPLCPSGYTWVNPMCYRIYAAAARSTQVTNCANSGGWLASLRSITESNNVWGLIGSQSAWIGLNDLTTEGTFVWAHGDSDTYRNWDPGEPNNSGDCVHIYSTNGRWDDDTCTVSHKGACEASPSCASGFFFVSSAGTCRSYPTSQPSRQPTSQPSRQPTLQPFGAPSTQPTNQPTGRPSTQPSVQPSRQPSAQPAPLPTSQPSIQPSRQPTCQPSARPSTQPSAQPSTQPSQQPSQHPSAQPSLQPSSAPSTQPSSQPSRQPSRQPSCRPTCQPSGQPSGQPSDQPSAWPTTQPSGQPSGEPSCQPSDQPSNQPSSEPSSQPSVQPSDQPSCQPSAQPSGMPTRQPSSQPTGQPSSQPSQQPSGQPSSQPTTQPSAEPSSSPSTQPSMQPSHEPSMQPSAQPSGQPTEQPSASPSRQPSARPSAQPSVQPSEQPSRQPSSQPSCSPTRQPTAQPSSQPSATPSTQPSSQPSMQPSGQPSHQPSCSPSGQPTVQPSSQPSVQPSVQPTCQPSSAPTQQPTEQPSVQPTSQPSEQPSGEPSRQPSMQPSQQPSSSPTCQPSAQPSMRPTRQPSTQPSVQPSSQPSGMPTLQPSVQPSAQPSGSPTGQPSTQPSRQPSAQPSSQPTLQPTGQPSGQPTTQPSGSPTIQPTISPSVQPSTQPSLQPSIQPSMVPSGQPSQQPSMQPSNQPTGQPSGSPTCQPSAQPSCQPSSRPSMQPSSQPSASPSSQPTAQPSTQPSAEPSMQPSVQPSSQPSGLPSSQPSRQPSRQPSSQPSTQPSNQPSSQPSLQPSSQPSCQPSKQPSGSPTCQPSTQPTTRPSTQPSSQPSAQPSDQPSGSPTSQPSMQPSMQPSSHPSMQPSGQPSRQPSTQPSAQPSISPTDQPSVQPSMQPLAQPSAQPSDSPTGQPSMQPSMQPTSQPSVQPSSQPSRMPSMQPSAQPSSLPTTQPSTQPSVQPSAQPSAQPCGSPTGQPTMQPSMQPSTQPSSQPSMQPTLQPSAQPSGNPTSQPSLQPSKQPSAQPSGHPSSQPSMQPSVQPSGLPTAQPSCQPSVQPSAQPSSQPSGTPSSQPSAQPSGIPSGQPTDQPTAMPSGQPSSQPSGVPSAQPSAQPSEEPSSQPSCQPSRRPSMQPSSQPSRSPSDQPSVQPSDQPSIQPSDSPSCQPTAQPSTQPSAFPTGHPSAQPSVCPSAQPSTQPTGQPSRQPSVRPTDQPFSQPTVQPSSHPSGQPSGQPSSQPTIQPSSQPLNQPTAFPSSQPSCCPSSQPSSYPSGQPSHQPSSHPTSAPTRQPSSQPTVQPSGGPSAAPTSQPSNQPVASPTAVPSSQPSQCPTLQPSIQPTSCPSIQPSQQPSIQPTRQPFGQPTGAPSVKPSYQPSRQPSKQPFVSPSSRPSSQPSDVPSRQPTVQPTKQPLSSPSTQPTCQPSSQPTMQPSMQPSRQPVSRPTSHPSAQPSMCPTTLSPTAQPSLQPRARPSGQPTTQPSSRPTTSLTRVLYLTSAVFSSNAQQVIVTFNLPVNLGGMTGRSDFSCDKVLFFPSASSYACSWSSSTQITVRGTTRSFLTLSSPIALSSTNGLVVLCADRAADCSHTVVVTAAVSLAAPATPLIPVVQLTAKSNISSCTAWQIDVSGASGNGGRRWLSASFYVQSVVFQSNTSWIERSLSSQFASSSLLIVNGSSLQAGDRYTLKVSLCNFLGRCATSNTWTVSVTNQFSLPVVAILGAANRTMQASSGLTVTAEAYTLQCNMIRNRNNLQYFWQLKLLNNIVPFPSVSKDVSSFALASGSLTSGKSYSLALTVRDRSTGLNASTSIAISVVGSDLVAVITPVAPQQLLTIGGVLTLNASSSYDPDGGMLSFAWSCKTKATAVPTISLVELWLPCALTKIKAGKTAVSLAANQSAAGSISVVFLLINATGAMPRSATASVEVKVIEVNKPLVKLLTSSSSVKYVNTGSSLSVSSTVLASSACNASWVMTGVLINGTTATKTMSIRAVTANRLTNVNLFVPSLSASLMMGSSAYAFTIACGASSLAITVNTNSPPRDGRFSVYPVQGYTLNTTFMLHSEMWIETDLPVSYTFSFSSASGALVTLRKASEISTVNALLPVGNNQSQVNVSMVAMDAFQAQSERLLSSVKVLAIERAAMTAAISSYLASSTVNADIDGLQNLITVATADLNGVADCSKAPNCLSLHRAACSNVSNTCGACLSGYLSVEASQSDNNLCLATSAVAAFSSAPKSCGVGASCASWQFCNTVTNQCVDRTKVCNSPNCSSHGTCTLVSSTNSSKILPSCGLLSATCSAICICRVGYGGSDCSVTTVDLTAEQAARAQLLSGLASVLSGVSNDASSLTDAATSLAAIIRSKDDISSQAIAAQASKLSSSILSQTLVVATSAVSSNVANVLTSVNVAVAASAASTTITNASTPATTASNSSVALAVLDNLPTDGQPYNAVYDTFRVSSYAFDIPASTSSTSSSNTTKPAATINVPIAMTDQEKLLVSTGQLVLPSVNIAPSSNSSTVSVAVVVVDQSQYQNVSGLASPVVTIKATGVEFVDIVMPNRPVVSAPAINFTIDCPPRVRILKNFTCVDSGTVMYYQCEGVSGIYKDACPVKSSTCSSLDVPGQTPVSGETCSVVNSTASTITCRCTLAVDDGVVAAGVVVKLVGSSDLSKTFKATAAFGSASAVGKAYIIITIFSSIWGSAFIVMLYFGWRYESKKKQHDTIHAAKIAAIQRTKISLGRILAKGPHKKKRRMLTASTMNLLGDDPTGTAREKLAQYISSIFPVVFEATNVLTGLQSELLQHHEYFNFFFRLQHHRAPIPMVVQMITMQGFLLFLLALLYDFNYPDDDGSCVTFTTPSSCLARKYMFDNKMSYCKWVYDDNECMFAPPAFSITATMYISMITSLSTSLAFYPLEKLIHLLAAPFSESKISAAPDSSAAPVASGDGERLASIRHIPDDAVMAHMEAIHYSEALTLQVVPLMERREARRIRLAKKLSSRCCKFGLPLLPVLAVGTIDKPSFTVESLLHELVLQREVLSGDHRQRFDRIWGLHPVRGEFLQKEYHHWWHGRQIYCVQNVIAKELADVRAAADHKIAELATASNVDRGFEIMQLFVLDLLGHHSPEARIFALKAEFDFVQVESASLRTKIAVGLFLFALNAFFVFYTMLRGYSKGLHWQQDYLRQYGLQMALDILIFETMQVMWMHFAVPYMVSKEVHAVYAQLQEAITHLCDSNYYHTNAACVNAPSYFFVSHHLAKSFPTLIESTLVLVYCSHLPGQAGKLWLDPLTKISKLEGRRIQRSLMRRLAGWFSTFFVVSLLVQMAAYVPMPLQSLAIRILEPLVLTGLSFGLYLIIARPALIVVVLAAIALIAGMLVWDYYRSKKAIVSVGADRFVGIVDEELSDVAHPHVASPAPPTAETNSRFYRLNSSDEEYSDSSSSNSDDDTESDVEHDAQNLSEYDDSSDSDAELEANHLHLHVDWRSRRSGAQAYDDQDEEENSNCIDIRQPTRVTPRHATNSDSSSSGDDSSNDTSSSDGHTHPAVGRLVRQNAVSAVRGTITSTSTSNTSEDSEVHHHPVRSGGLTAVMLSSSSGGSASASSCSTESDILDGI